MSAEHQLVSALRTIRAQGGKLFGLLAGIASLIVTLLLISLVIGEGGSGGAIAIAAANAVLMLEHSIYSVISPEGCASLHSRSNSHRIHLGCRNGNN